MNITEDYCSFELCKLLKEKWFDSPVQCTYDEYGVVSERWTEYSDDYTRRSWLTPCVTHQMAIKWLREEHKTNINIIYDLQTFVKTDGTKDNIDVYEVDIITKNGTIYIGNYNHYESACEAGIKYCLINLIK